MCVRHDGEIDRSLLSVQHSLHRDECLDSGQCREGIRSDRCHGDEADRALGGQELPASAPTGRSVFETETGTRAAIEMCLLINLSEQSLLTLSVISSNIGVGACAVIVCVSLCVCVCLCGGAGAGASSATILWVVAPITLHII